MNSWEKDDSCLPPIVDLDLGTNRAKTAFAGSRNVTYFPQMISASKRSETDIIWFTTSHDFPDVESHIPRNLYLVNRAELTPVFLKYLFHGKCAMLNGFHYETRL